MDQTADAAPPEAQYVEPQHATLYEEGMTLESGVRLGPVKVCYEAYGELNAAKDNVILVCHALTGSAHAGGLHRDTKLEGWWSEMIGPGRAFDTDQYYVICPNVLGSCYGTTGPASINPETGKPYGVDFPVITLKDMVNVMAALLDWLGIDKVLAVVGGSMGGMLTLRWAVSHPDRVRAAIPIATTHRHSPQQIAFNEVSRQAIMNDPDWDGGNYYEHEGPRLGLGVARMIGHITYMSEHSMERKFGRRLWEKERYGYDFSTEFAVESYLRYKGKRFVERFDANSMLYLTKALDYFDLAAGYRSLTEAFEKARAMFLLIAFSSDWLYPPANMKEVARAIRRADCDATYYEVSSDYGHDAFLLEFEKMEALIGSFLKRVQKYG